MRDKAKRIMEHDFPLNLRGRIYPILENASEAARTLFYEYPELLAGPLVKNIRGHLLSFIIATYFSPEFLPKTLPMNSHIIPVNNFGYKVPELITEHTRTYVRRSHNKEVLAEYKPKYLLRMAINNGFAEEQICFSIMDDNMVYNDMSPKCAIITYGLDRAHKISFARLVMPDAHLNQPLCYYDLHEEMKVYYNDRPPEPRPSEKELATLKEKVLVYLKANKE